jgi:hypothetical protein
VLFVQPVVARADFAFVPPKVVHSNQARQRYLVAHFGHPGFTRSEVGDNFPRWLKQGFEADGPAGCNTWTAPATTGKIS